MRLCFPKKELDLNGSALEDGERNIGRDWRSPSLHAVRGAIVTFLPETRWFALYILGVAFEFLEPAFQLSCACGNEEHSDYLLVST